MFRCYKSMRKKKNSTRKKKRSRKQGRAWSNRPDSHCNFLISTYNNSWRRVNHSRWISDPGNLLNPIARVKSAGREARDQIPPHATLRFGDATVGDQSRSTERTGEIETVKPSLQAPLVEHVSTLQLPHLLSLLQLRQTHHAAIGTAAFASATVREEPVQAQLIGEEDDVGESRRYDGGVVGGEIGTGIAGGTVEERAETGEEYGEEREEHQRDRIGRDVTELTL
ncbi:hypothetical protein Bca101_054777 [Brassica carinata]